MLASVCCVCAAKEQTIWQCTGSFAKVAVMRMVTTVQAVYDAKSEEIGPGIYRFKAEIGRHL